MLFSSVGESLPAPGMWRSIVLGTVWLLSGRMRVMGHADLDIGHAAVGQVVGAGARRGTRARGTSIGTLRR
jgi:hypothetical protein